jgi:hypothetical protein
MTTTKGTDMTTTKKSTRRSRCVVCARQLKEVAVIKASDSDLYIAEFGVEDDELVWIDREGRSLCDASHNSTYHNTPSDMRNQF